MVSSWGVLLYKDTVGGPFEKMTLFGRSVQGILYDDVLKNGFGFSI